MREEFTCPVPGGHRFRNGDGPKILWDGDGTLTCSWDRPVPVRRVLALDEAPPDDDTAQELSRLLRENLSPELCSRVESLIVHLMGAGPDPNSPSVLTNDKPPPFPGQPRRPGLDRRSLAGGSRGNAKLAAHTAVGESLKRMFPTMRPPRQL